MKCLKKIHEIIDQLYQISAKGEDKYFGKFLPEQQYMARIKDDIVLIEDWNSQQEAMRKKLEVPNTFTKFFCAMKDTNASAGLTKYSNSFIRSHTVVSFDYTK